MLSLIIWFKQVSIGVNTIETILKLNYNINLFKSKQGSI